jgi:hypothetical protein
MATPQQFLDTFRRLTRQNPLAFVGGALAAGLLTGGAIAPRVLGRVLTVGGGLAWRFLVLPAIKERVLAAVESHPTREGEEENEAERYRQGHRA